MVSNARMGDAWPGPAEGGHGREAQPSGSELPGRSG